MLNKQQKKMALVAHKSLTVQGIAVVKNDEKRPAWMLLIGLDDPVPCKGERD